MLTLKSFMVYSWDVAIKTGIVPALWLEENKARGNSPTRPYPVWRNDSPKKTWVPSGRCLRGNFKCPQRGCIFWFMACFLTSMFIVKLPHSFFFFKITHESFVSRVITWGKDCSFSPAALVFFFPSVINHLEIHPDNIVCPTKDISQPPLQLDVARGPCLNQWEVC